MATAHAARERATPPAMSTPEEPILRLDQFLKLTGAAESGGQGKALVQAGKVKVNGEVETRRGRKLRVGGPRRSRGANGRAR